MNCEEIKRKPYIHVGTNRITKEAFKDIKNSIIGKPYGGLWASPFISDNPRISAWIDWCLLNDFNLSRLGFGVAFTIKKEARWIFLHNDNDLEELGNEVGFVEFKCRGESFISVDFEAAAELYDVIYFSNGKKPMRMKKINSRTKVNTQKWDCESIVVTRFSAIGRQRDIGHPLSYYFRDKVAQENRHNEEIYIRKEAEKKRKK